VYLFVAPPPFPRSTVDPATPHLTAAGAIACSALPRFAAAADGKPGTVSPTAAAADYYYYGG